MTGEVLPARSHDALFVQYGFDDACGLVPPGLDRDAAMRGAASPSSNILDGLRRDGLCIDEFALELHRPTHLSDLHAEFDAELFCRELSRRWGKVA